MRILVSLYLCFLMIEKQKWVLSCSQFDKVNLFSIFLVLRFDGFVSFWWRFVCSFFQCLFHSWKRGLLSRFVLPFSLSLTLSLSRSLSHSYCKMWCLKSEFQSFFWWLVPLLFIYWQKTVLSNWNRILCSLFFCLISDVFSVRRNEMYLTQKQEDNPVPHYFIFINESIILLFFWHVMFLLDWMKNRERVGLCFKLHVNHSLRQCSFLYLFIYHLFLHPPKFKNKIQSSNQSNSFWVCFFLLDFMWLLETDHR
jgi:hypothetical protein